MDSACASSSPEIDRFLLILAAGNTAQVAGLCRQVQGGGRQRVILFRQVAFPRSTCDYELGSKSPFTGLFGPLPEQYLLPSRLSQGHLRCAQ